MKKPIYSEKLALLYGAMLGDGCLSKCTKNYFVCISGHLNDDYPFFQKILLPIIEEFRNRKTKIKSRPKQGSIEFNFSDVNMFELINNLGFPIGKKGPYLKISNNFTEKNYKQIIQGYFATDGCIVITNNNGVMYPRIEFSSISKLILKQVLVYLISKGMKGKIYVSHKAHDNNQTLYRIQFNGKKQLEIFMREIGFVNPKHQQRYEKYAGGVIRKHDLHVTQSDLS